MNDEQLRLTR